MVKDRIIELDNGINYYILEEISYNNKKYILAALCNLGEETVDADKYLVLEIKIEDNNLITADIEDDNLANKVIELLVEKVKANI